MFFSSPPEKPFANMDEGMALHPSWELIMPEYVIQE